MPCQMPVRLVALGPFGMSGAPHQRSVQNRIMIAAPKSTRCRNPVAARPFSTACLTARCRQSSRLQETGQLAWRCRLWRANDGEILYGATDDRRASRLCLRTIDFLVRTECCASALYLGIG